MKKMLSIITLDQYAGQFYAQQIHALFGSFVEISTFHMLDGSINNIICQPPCDLYLVSTDAFENSGVVNRYIPMDAHTVTISVTFTKRALDDLQSEPEGTKAMFVNISRKMSIESITRLNQLGVNNIDFIPVYPDLFPLPSLDFAVTPGEVRYVPACAKHVLDIGQRVLDSNTIVEIALKLQLEHLLEQPAFGEYFESIAANSYSFNLLFARSTRLESQFEILMNILDAGIIAVDAQGIVYAYNSKAQNITGTASYGVMGKNACEVLPFIPFEDCKRSLSPLSSLLVKVGEMDVNLTVTPVVRAGQYIGAFAVVQKFTDEEYKQHTLRIQLLNRGHKAKYTFEDIIGNSPAIIKACDVGKKMAASNGAILITGESGTGKELFAHAIHNHSPRRNYPFVAINCAAIPDNLLESELFGYEEGAFTGAKKGGKLGLFEFAHHGTLFLDEIEGMSPTLQVKLLRVVQEKEVLHVGGNKIISVDVRIVAASNESLLDLVQRGSFRKDLYYRLNTLPITLPPLRERGDDIMLLFETMKREFGGNFTLSEAARQAFYHHRWDGNIRELRNYAEYLTYINNPVVEVADLPPALRTSEVTIRPSVKWESQGHSLLHMVGNHMEDYLLVLQLLCKAAQSHRSLGRKSISDEAQSLGRYLTEQEVRALLLHLEQLGLVKISKGRGGSKITAAGVEALEKLEASSLLS